MVLADQLATAEQEERRRLALFLHDGPVQSLAGIALMLDAVVHALEDGRTEDGKRILISALERHRETIRSLRDLSFDLEPVVLRDQGFGPAVQELVDQLCATHGVEIAFDAGAAETARSKAYVALYQVVREALNQAVRRGPSRIDVRVAARDDGSLETTVEDDGAGERRRGGIQVLEERLRPLDGTVEAETEHGSRTIVRVCLPAHALRE